MLNVYFLDKIIGIPIKKLLFKKCTTPILRINGYVAFVLIHNFTKQSLFYCVYNTAVDDVTLLRHQSFNA